MKVLFFVNRITESEIAQAKANGWILRNASSYHEGDFLESCDAVAGCAPAAYEEAFGIVEAETEKPEKKSRTSRKRNAND